MILTPQVDCCSFSFYVFLFICFTQSFVPSPRDLGRLQWLCPREYRPRMQPRRFVSLIHPLWLGCFSKHILIFYIHYVYMHCEFQDCFLVCAWFQNVLAGQILAYEVDYRYASIFVGMFSILQRLRLVFLCFLFAVVFDSRPNGRQQHGSRNNGRRQAPQQTLLYKWIESQYVLQWKHDSLKHLQKRRPRESF